MLLDVLQSAPGRPPGLHGSIEISCPNAVLQDAVLIARCTRARVNLADKMLSPLVLCPSWIEMLIGEGSYNPTVMCPKLMEH